MAFISFVLAFPCLCISVDTDNNEANVNDPSHAVSVHYNRNMIHIYTMYNIEHNITKMCNKVAVI